MLSGTFRSIYLLLVVLEVCSIITACPTCGGKPPTLSPPSTPPGPKPTPEPSLPCGCSKPVNYVVPGQISTANVGNIPTQYLPDIFIVELLQSSPLWSSLSKSLRDCILKSVNLEVQSSLPFINGYPGVYPGNGQIVPSVPTPTQVYYVPTAPQTVSPVSYEQIYVPQTTPVRYEQVYVVPQEVQQSATTNYAPVGTSNVLVGGVGPQVNQGVVF